MTHNLYSSLSELYSAMRNTFQFETLDVFGHGVSVNQAYLQCLRYLSLKNDEDIELDLPEDLANHLRNNSVLKKLHAVLSHTLLDKTTMSRYQIWHDCGKPLCQQDRRFPDHAQWSHKQWLHLYPGDT